MYYETRVHTLRKVSGPAEAAHIIKNGPRASYEALCWQGTTQEIYCVDDAGIHNTPFLEVAILRKEPDGKFIQIESITAGWIESSERLAKALAEAETGLPFKRVQLIIDKPKGDEVAWFTCTCCDEEFKGNVAQQLKYDQDTGYGLCNNCLKNR